MRADACTRYPREFLRGYAVVALDVPPGVSVNEEPLSINVRGVG